jgi:hypothetical protein
MGERVRLLRRSAVGVGVVEREQGRRDGNVCACFFYTDALSFVLMLMLMRMLLLTQREALVVRGSCLVVRRASF